MKVNVYTKIEQENNPNFLDWVFLPIQTHSNNIIEIKTWKENLDNCDWIYSSIKNDFTLWVKIADCTWIVFYDDQNYWIIHAGWRWLVNWIIEKMLEKFDNPKIFVWPFLKSFEIQKDFCYDLIYDKFSNKYFENIDWKIIFNFEKALKSILWEKAIFDERDTFNDNNLYSFRRDKTKKRNYITISK